MLHLNKSPVLMFQEEPEVRACPARVQFSARMSIIAELLASDIPYMSGYRYSLRAGEFSQIAIRILGAELMAQQVWSSVGLICMAVNCFVQPRN
jgi:hypothetical protein